MRSKGILLMLAAAAAACCCALAIALPMQAPVSQTVKASSPAPSAAPLAEGGVSEAAEREEASPSEEVSEAVVGDGAAAAEQFAPIAQDDAGEYFEGELMVELPEGVTAAGLNAQLADLDYVATRDITDDDVSFGWVKIGLAEGVDLQEAAADLQDRGIVNSAQPNYVYRVLADSASDSEAEAGTGFATQADSAAALAAGALDVQEQAISNDKFIDKNAGWMKSIGLPKAWKLQPSASSVTVAVIDTGCDVDHSDFNGTTFVYPYNALTDKKGAAAVADADGHGTHVAGIIAATPDNGKGIAGVARDAKLMIVKAIDKDKSSTDVILKAYKYIVAKRKSDPSIRIVNMSLGGAKGYDPALMRALDAAFYDYGILPVFAAGNTGSKEAPYYCFPCDYSEVGIGVINVSRSVAKNLVGKADPSSNYNVGIEKTKSLSAPGDEVASTWPRSLGKSKYKKLTGTSMAAPIVSGVAALAWAANPKLSALQLKSLLFSTASDIKRKDGSGGGFDAYTGYGLIRADRAVSYAKKRYLTGREAVAVGKSIKLRAPEGGRWTWSAYPKSRAKVSASGKVTGLAAGEVVIKAKDAVTGVRLYKTVVVYSRAIVGSSVKIGGKAKFNVQVVPLSACTWESSNTSIATVGKTSGVVRGLKAGTATITATLTAAPTIKIRKKVTVEKLANPLKVKASAASVAYTRVRNKAVTLSGAVTVTKEGKGALTYAKVADGSSSRLLVNSKTGKVTVKKGTQRGTYRVKVAVRAAGTSTYAARTRTVTIEVRVV